MVCREGNQGEELLTASVCFCLAQLDTAHYATLHIDRVVLEQRREKTMNEKTCLIITPFDAGATHITDTVKRALAESGIVPMTINRMSIPGGLVGETILDALVRADLVVVDISRQNPSVMYELGFAHALRKPTILITNRIATDRLPADLEGHLYIVYDEGNLASLRDNIARFASQMLGAKSEGSQS